MTPIIVAVAVAVIIVVGVFLVMMTRSRRDDEGERFRRVADLTSRWSRQVQSAPTEITPPYGPDTTPPSRQESRPESEPEMAPPRAGKTESVDRADS
ncbi:MAG TPA: hypothetical protein VGL75_16115 [Acidothermaceae bacterium]